jgi:hypothetical protein
MGPYCFKVSSGSMERIRPIEESTSVISGTPRVFISFQFDEDKVPVGLFRHQAKNSKQMKFIDYSVKGPWEQEKWKKKCEERIRRSSILVVAIGATTYQSGAINWEIETAHKLGKPIFGMRIYGDKNHRIPEPLQKYNAEILEWKLEAVQNKLDKIKEIPTKSEFRNHP